MRKILFFLFFSLPVLAMGGKHVPYVRGTLPNGMTYYLQRNTEMPGQAVFALVHNIGTLVEDPKEYGVAHFLEHMAFQGTEHFPDEEMVHMLERHGVMYGHDINATTSENKTIYQLTSVPTDNTAFLDSCLWVMRDWACALTLDPKKIDKERSVIIEEIKMRNTAQNRMQQQWGDTLLKGSRYEAHDVISTPQQVATVAPETLRHFYHKWHRPNLEAVVIVGDINVNTLEGRLRHILATVPKAEGSCPLKTNDQYSHVPNQKSIRFSLSCDADAQGEMLAVIYRLLASKVDTMSAENSVRNDCRTELFNTMATLRAQVRSQSGGQPFGGMTISYMPLKRGYDNIQFGCAPTPGDEQLALRIMMLEADRLKQNGFSQEELDRAKAALHKMTDRNMKYTTISNDVLAEALINNYLEGSPVLSFDEQYHLTMKALSNITLDEMNQTVRRWLSTPNRTIVVTGPTSMDSLLYADVSHIVNTVDDMNLKDYTFNLPPVDSIKTLMTQLPKMGRIVKTTLRKDFEAKEWTLSNGVHVLYKPVSTDKGKVVLQAVSRGGTSRYPLDMLPAAEQTGTYVMSAGVGTWDNIQLYKQLQLHGLTTNIAVNTYSDRITCSVMPDEAESLFQWNHLYFTQPHLDADILRAINNQMMIQQQNPLQDSVTIMKGNYSPRILPRNAAYFQQITPEKIVRVWNQEFGNPADFLFILTGNINETEAKRLVCQYIASLPASKPSGRDYVDVTVAPKEQYQNKDIHVKLSQPQAIGVVSFDLYTMFSDKEALANKIIEQVFQSRVMENIRQKEGGVYTIQVHGETNYLPKGSLEIAVEHQASPVDVKRIQKKIIEEWNNMLEKGLSQNEMQRVICFLHLKMVQDDRKAEPWAEQIAIQYLCRRTVLTPIVFSSLISSLTLTEVNGLLRHYQHQGTSLSVVMHL